MLQGTGSNVGKSLLVAGLCRAAVRRGLKVAPFKPQNMSNNAAVTADGGEIGRAQAVQALASGLAPCVDMNPILLKPETDIGAQVVVRGKRLMTVKAREYSALKPTLMPAVLESFERLRARFDLVLVEGAGSPAEINLRAGDIANMGFAQAAKVPVVLVGDIDRGGVIAQMVGTEAVLDPDDAAWVHGFLINRFRGDPSLFDDGYRAIETRTGWTGFGVLPWFDGAWRLPAEDVLDLRSSNRSGGYKVVCLGLARIANFDDLDPLLQEDALSVQVLRRGEVIPGDADLVVIPGSKSTISDLSDLRAQGWDIDLAAHVRRGGRVLGICGGYQMLGRTIADPLGIEGPPGEVEGLGLLDIATVMSGDKRLSEVRARHVASDVSFEGYEIHIGTSEGPDRQRPFAALDGRPEGATDATGKIVGTYLHGMFVDDAFRRVWLAGFDVEACQLDYAHTLERTLDELAEHMERHLKIDELLALAV